ncbi:hypothetical protein [Enterobacter sp. ECC-019]|uniref:hypothetical protein n=1 Tax=Enterobacter sp. ECC-019 TaxID=3116478 RepID=UPI003753FF6E
MNTHAGKKQENKSQSATNAVFQKQRGGESIFQFVDNRPEVIAQRKMQEMVSNSPSAKQAAQLRPMVDNRSTKQHQPTQKERNNANVPIQGMWIGVSFLRKGIIDSGYGIETDNVSREYLEMLLQRDDIAPDSRTMISLAIDMKIAEEHLGIIHEGLGKFGEETENSWIRSITGGGTHSLSGKRADTGGIKTDMEDEEYTVTKGLTESFYNLSDVISVRAPRVKNTSLFRGFVIERPESAEAMLANIGTYSDQLPSSFSWQPETSLGFAQPGEGTVGVFLEVVVPPDHPMIAMSYPNNTKPEGKPKPVDIGQAEVLVAPLKYTNPTLVCRCGGTVDIPIYHVRAEVITLTRSEVFQAINQAEATARSERKKKKMIITDEESWAKDGEYETMTWSSDSLNYQKLTREQVRAQVQEGWFANTGDKIWRVTGNDTDFDIIDLQEI